MALTDGLVAYWRLDEASGSRADASGNGYTLTDNNTVGSAAGNISALAGDFIAANSESLSSTAAGLVAPFTIALPWTWVLWIYPESPIESSLSEPISSSDGSKGIMCRRRGLSAFGSSSIAWDIINNSSTFYRVEQATNTPINTWSMIALKYDGAGLAYARTNNSTSSSVSISGTLTPYSTFRLGARANAISGSFWDGRVAHVGLWSRALTSGELDTLYNSGAGMDPTNSQSIVPHMSAGYHWWAL